MKIREIKRFGMTFNDWNELYHLKGREYGGTTFLKDQLSTLKLAIHNGKQLDKHYTTPDNGIERWNFDGKE